MEIKPGIHTAGNAAHQELVTDFLAQKNIAVAGVSHLDQSPANAIARKLREAGYKVYPVNPRLASFDGTRCYPSVRHIGLVPDGVITVTRPEVTRQIVRDCIEAGIRRIWMHDMLGTKPRVGRSLSARLGSADPDAVRLAEGAGMKVISGGCPMQHVPPVDPFHKCVLWTCTRLGNYDARPRPAPGG